MQLEILKDRNSIIKTREKITTPSIGFVPTMGNLHAGHISLLEQSLKENDVTFFSIFVNPTQFGPNEDFDKYPRTFESDLVKIKTCLNNFPDKKVYLFCPSVTDIYNDGFDTTINPGPMSKILEGEFRQTHFSGVCTVVYLLFSLVKPTKSYFGQKDYQQFKLVQKMTSDLNLNIDIVLMPIIREADGLAMSSRNQYLTSDQRAQALVLNQTLNKVKDTLINAGINTANELCQIISSQNNNWNYLKILNSDNLSNNYSDHYLIIGTYQLGATRLLDNLLVKIKK